MNLWYQKFIGCLRSHAAQLNVGSNQHVLWKKYLFTFRWVVSRNSTRRGTESHQNKAKDDLHSLLTSFCFWLSISMSVLAELTSHPWCPDLVKLADGEELNYPSGCTNSQEGHPYTITNLVVWESCEHKLFKKHPLSLHRRFKFPWSGSKLPVPNVIIAVKLTRISYFEIKFQQETLFPNIVILFLNFISFLCEMK